MSISTSLPSSGRMNGAEISPGISTLCLSDQANTPTPCIRGGPGLGPSSCTGEETADHGGNGSDLMPQLCSSTLTICHIHALSCPPTGMPASTPELSGSWSPLLCKAGSAHPSEIGAEKESVRVRCWPSTLGMNTEPGVSPEYRDGPAAAPDMGTWVVLVLMVNSKSWLRGPAGHGGSGQVLPPADEETQVRPSSLCSEGSSIHAGLWGIYNASG